MASSRFLFMVSGRNVPSTRFRMLPYVHALRSMGFHCDVAYSSPEKYGSYQLIGWRLSQRLKRATRQWHALRASFTNYSAIIIERELFDLPDFSIEEKLSRLPGRLILDIDDGVFLRYPEKFNRLFGMCDHVIAGSHLIAETIRNDCRAVSVIPTVLDLDEYPPPRNRKIVSNLRIGWIGTDSNVCYLNQALPAIRQLQKHWPIHLKIITGDRNSLSKLDSTDVDIEFVKWTPNTAIKELAECQIGIMPLPDEDWQRYKCGCKLLQYMACGIPSVSSAVGVNREIVKHGENGYLVTRETDWEHSLHRLITQPDLRSQIGNKGRKSVEEKYDLQIQVPKFLEILQSSEMDQAQ